MQIYLFCLEAFLHRKPIAYQHNIMIIVFAIKKKLNLKKMKNSFCVVSQKLN